MRKIFIVFVVSLLLAGCFPSYPDDVGVDELPEYQPNYPEIDRGAEEWDRSREREESDYDEERFDDIAEGWTTESGSSSSEEGCPNGCTSHKSGCDIKGNISFNSKEKIYHVPGQNFYNETKISPQYGERWFCTEAEANGCRKAKN